MRHVLQEDGRMEGEGRAIARLRTEHQDIIRTLNIVGDEAINAVHPKSNGTKRISKLILQLGVLLKTHFAHEQTALYGPLRSTLGGDSPTDSMLEEHRSIQRAYERVLAALAECESQASSSQAREGLRFHIDSLQGITTEHIRKEEKIIFWIAELNL